jgi:S-adenosylmethionine synthetase
MNYLRPDAKSQVTIEYDDNHKPIRIDSIVVSTQHDDFNENEEVMLEKIKSDVIQLLIPRVKAKLKPELQALFTDTITYHVNPTGKFVIGGPHGDTGLTGRKIIVDTYGGKGAHGGGAGVCKEVLVQVSYAIGVAKPTNIYINTYGTAKVTKTDAQIADIVYGIFDMRPYAIEQRLKLRNPIYSDSAAYGHMGRIPEVKTLTFKDGSGQQITKEVELFTWEKLDYTDKVKAAFSI